ncbi:hypothetical protein Micbo1qcDRAFT_207192 [Microdochium bolleyi]|uniref:Uncharacterized protein n=1 Tax=Microdochium bolleyi TaxID=196109 RepID=A0A136ITU3_9PEZI|nr:hypothetical protein Micbo1qcDRAFT_207192 [Microdochium bolleyi]
MTCHPTTPIPSASQAAARSRRVPLSSNHLNNDHLPFTESEPNVPMATMMPNLAVGLALTFAVLMGLMLATTCMLYIRGPSSTSRSDVLGFTPLTTIHEASDEDEPGRSSA